MMERNLQSGENQLCPVAILQSQFVMHFTKMALQEEVICIESPSVTHKCPFLSMISWWPEHNDPLSQTYRKS